LLFVDVTKDSKKFEKCVFTLADKRSGGLMYINDLGELNKAVDFLYGLYTEKKLFKVLLDISEGYKKRGQNGGISDMTALGEYYKRASKKIGEISDIINGETYDMAINMVEQGMVMENGIKRIEYINGLPFGTVQKSGKKVKMCCLHFTGPTKFYMKYFANGNVNYFTIFGVKALMYLRDKYSGALNSNQRDFAKKMMLKLRL